MKILVTGRDGQLGFELERALAVLGEVRATGRRDLDLAQPQAVTRAIAAWQPDVVVNAAAYTAVDRAESDEASALAVNGRAPGAMAAACARSGALLVHFSTDYVFDGLATRAYDEADSTHPINAYGRTKLEGERAIEADGRDALILRTAWVYAARGQNFVRTIERLARTREEITVVDDQLGTPTWARHLAIATAIAVARLARRDARTTFFAAQSVRVFNLTSPDWTSRFDLARAIVEEGRSRSPNIRWARVKPCPTSAMPSPARRPLRTVLNPAAIETSLGIRLPPWRTALAQCFAEWPARADP